MHICWQYSGVTLVLSHAGHEPALVGQLTAESVSAQSLPSGVHAAQAFGFGFGAPPHGATTESTLFVLSVNTPVSVPLHDGGSGSTWASAQPQSAAATASRRISLCGCVRVVCVVCVVRVV